MCPSWCSIDLVIEAMHSFILFYLNEIFPLHVDATCTEPAEMAVHLHSMHKCFGKESMENGGGLSDLREKLNS